jgi:hypothetical protein
MNSVVKVLVVGRLGLRPQGCEPDVVTQSVSRGRRHGARRPRGARARWKRSSLTSSPAI